MNDQYIVRGVIVGQTGIVAVERAAQVKITSGWIQGVEDNGHVGTADGNVDNRIVAEHLNIYYGDFLAVRDVNMVIEFMKTLK